jgi:hypothetical protein
LVIGQHETLPRWLFVAGLFFARSIAISRAMSLRPRTRPKPNPRVSKPAHDAALDFLARPKQYPLADAQRADLIQVVEGYTSPHDHDAARSSPLRASASRVQSRGQQSRGQANVD